MRDDKLVADLRNPYLDAGQQRRQIDLVQRFDALHAERREHDSALEETRFYLVVERDFIL